MVGGGHENAKKCHCFENRQKNRVYYHNCCNIHILYLDFKIKLLYKII